MPQKIEPHYLRKTAFVYLRQSSPGQVKRNVEGGRRQRRMEERMQDLGWPRSRVRVLGGDTGHSGGSLHGRDDYQVIIDSVMAGRAGAVGARELSRLIRDNQDWNQLVRLCRFQDVLLVDEHRVYDASDPQDRVVLGVAGAFNEFELSLIVERMQLSRLQKAKRGELFEGMATGYVCRVESLCEKHPDVRVQRAVEKVFDHFDRCTSVLQLHDQLREEEFKLPTVPPGRDWRDVEWIVPSYAQLLYLLKNPVYAGIYVRGRKKTFSMLDEAGHLKKQRRRVSREQWEVFLEGHHEPYIGPERWERNLEKIASNTRGGGMKRAPQESPSLLVGLLRCRRCGCKLQSRYSNGRVRYTCRGGAKRRESSRKTCFSFTATRVEEYVGECVLEVIRPAGIAAAREAAMRLAAERRRRRQLIVDRLRTCQEAEARASREYKATDATYRSVRNKLAAEWDETLAAVEAEEARLAAFDARSATLPNAEQQRELDRLSEDVDRIWHHPRVSTAFKKQIVRTLVEEIVVELDEERDEIHLRIHWTGGHHTEWHEPRRSPKRADNADLKEVVETLRKVLRDSSIAAVLNREQLRHPSRETWNAKRVSSFRRDHGIAGFSEKAKESGGWMTQAEVANCLSISAMSVTRLVQAGILPAEQPSRRLPAVIRRRDLNHPRVKKAVTVLKTSHNHPLTDDPNQKTLLFPEDS
jgi:DNA invertase Pin-like site-specific DNA recombinase